MSNDQVQIANIILAINDVQLDRKIKHILVSPGITIRTAANGTDVIMEACKSPDIHLYILSTGLEGMNAFETIVALRQINRVVPIILLTEHITLEMLRLATLVGCNELMQNPIDEAELKLVISKYLKVHPKSLSDTHKNTGGAFRESPDLPGV